MFSKLLFGLVAARVAMAVPITEPLSTLDFTPDTLAEAQELKKSLGHLAEQRSHLDDTEWKDLRTRKEILDSPPPIDYDFLNNFTADVHLDIEKRGPDCKHSKEAMVVTEQEFNDWDVQLSQLVCAGQNPIDVFVQNGFSVGNSVSVNGNISPTMIASYISGLVGFSFDKTWTSSAAQNIKGTVSPGECGAMVLNPTTRRRYGVVNTGCIGNQKQIGTFMTDQRLYHDVNNILLPKGDIKMCARKWSGGPMPACSGGGKLT